MPSKTTRAFRTISEAADELDLQPHVLRFWESKFPSFKPIKRGGGRRFYRPEDIEFLRGIKILLHDERHPIKDVQKLIRVKGAARVADLGRSIKKAAIAKDVKDTVLVPEYIQGAPSRTLADEASPTAAEEFAGESFFPDEEEVPDKQILTEPDYLTPEDSSAKTSAAVPEPEPTPEPISEPVKSKGLLGSIHSIEAVPTGLTDKERGELELALGRLRELRQQWQDFKQDTPPQ